MDIDNIVDSEADVYKNTYTEALTGKVQEQLDRGNEVEQVEQVKQDKFLIEWRKIWC